MMLRVLAVSMIGLSLAGCAGNSGLSGDVYSASEAKQVQNVTYGTIVHVRPVQIQGGDESNVIGAIGGAVLGWLPREYRRWWHRSFTGNRCRCCSWRRSWSRRSGCDEQDPGC
ncbi:Outer membrane lipoprotein slyB precursor [Kluyvera intermedia]|nr:Outer membrane lipoprotein slyB precursor [Kluyvera intermedia]